MFHATLQRIVLPAIGLTALVLLAACDQKAAEKTDNAPAVQTVESETYPLDICLVSGDKLDAMGEPITYTHEGVMVKFCCRSCIKTFNKDPEKYLAKLKAAKQGESSAAGTDKDNHDHASHSDHKH